MALAIKNLGWHCPVLLDEAVNALITRTNGIYIDGTFGRGHHSRLVLTRIDSGARLIVFDKDPQAIQAAYQVADSRLDVVHGSFTKLREVLTSYGNIRLSGILLDLGVSSPQIDDPARGFSFRHDGPLDMRMDPTCGESAAQWLAHVDERELIRVIRDYGEERFAIQIAKAISARRAASRYLGPLERTSELAKIVGRSVKTREKGQDPATRTFQAIRIHINQELSELPIILETALESLEQGGRLVVISFHSLEDRIVKRFLQSNSRAPAINRYIPIRVADLPTPPLRILGRVFASEAEVVANPRARSAVMRIAERVLE
ncbi:16S rRNA (cytosine(1402)-N(4))-methyltransferase RsmH [Candidatus Vallotia tarda]|uniref:Ribosomal RNA small subunit methyltransferase H n=1 Tax=Candidatus Vallotiella hemipterorum TaxID=1177213 RepID=A0A916JSJ8_9BURK|nr:16S rRNA (cytosine(1402)-N(4))-methyltransferase RsmH [Candidatus Vallotia tarda]CAG7599193.1 Ribosomal RNA small subunit methyltransferase H [Candidatus Vallotia tarda]